VIPIDIRHQGTKKTVEYLLDLYRSPTAAPLYRSKLMVVGFANVGKTTMVDCLFPMTGVLFQRVSFLPINSYSYCVLQGNKFTQYKTDTQTSGIEKEVVLKNQQWSLITNEDARGFCLVSKDDPRPEAGLWFYCEESDETDEGEDRYLLWVSRLRRVCRNEATHGIDIQSLKIDNSITQEYFRRQGREGVLDFSVWDFAGQNDYYNNHHYFLSARSVFLVLWKMSEGVEKGMKGLEFWFRSLAGHLLSSHSPSHPGEEFYSIIVVGTFLDDPSVKRGEKVLRDREIRELAASCGLLTSLKCFEVSCAAESMENIDSVQKAIFEDALGHSYMGERVPQSYLQVFADLRKTAAERSSEDINIRRDGPRFSVAAPLFITADDSLPVVDLSYFLVSRDAGLVKRALGLFSLWGECLYFDSPPELSNLVILDPRFLAKGILAELFNAADSIKAMRADGTVKHANLAHVWKKLAAKGDEEISEVLCQDFVRVLETLGVCFVVQEDPPKKEFLDQSMMIPGLLPTRGMSHGSKFEKYWSRDPPFDRPIEMERNLLFNVLPMDLVSRLLVRLHPHIQDSQVWQDEVLLVKDNTQAWLRVSVPDNSFCVTLRGANTESCSKMVRVITDEVKIVSGSYPGITFTEAIRSPFSMNTLISCHSIMRAKEARTGLSCPETGFPLRPDALLHQGGYTTEAPKREPPWWDTAFSSVAPETLIVPLLNGEQPQLTETFKGLLMKVGMSLKDVGSAYAVNNPRLRQGLRNSALLLEGKIEDTRSLFLREDWRTDDVNMGRRRAAVGRLGEYTSSFEWNDGSWLPLVPMIQKLPEPLAVQIATHGFGMLPVAENCLFGNGLYFTSSADYLDKCQSGAPIIKWKLGEKAPMVYLLSLVLPGNPFPIIYNPDNSTSTGMPCRPGYQSHFAILGEPHGGVEKELVIFDPSQALPLFFWTEALTPEGKALRDHFFSPFTVTTILVNRRAQSLPPYMECFDRREWNYFVDRAMWKIPEYTLAALRPPDNRQSSWWRPLISPSPELLIPVVGNGVQQDPTLCEKLALLIRLLGEEMEVVESAFWINNPPLATQFELFRDCTSARHQLNPAEFNATTWRGANDAHVLEACYENLQARLAQASDLLQLEGVLPVAQGTKENSARRIAKNGFGTVAKLDPGWYGQGIYFSTRMRYAKPFAREALDGNLTFVVGLAIPGNSFPVTVKSLRGQSCRKGYQSHYVVVGPTGNPLQTPPTATSDDELVVFEPAQVLPLFLVHANGAKFKKVSTV